MNARVRWKSDKLRIIEFADIIAMVVGVDVVFCWFVCLEIYT